MSKKRAHEIGIPSVCPWTAGACRDSADRVEKCQIYPPHTGTIHLCINCVPSAESRDWKQEYQCATCIAEHADLSL